MEKNINSYYINFVDKTVLLVRIMEFNRTEPMLQYNFALRQFRLIKCSFFIFLHSLLRLTYIGGLILELSLSFPINGEDEMFYLM